MKTCPSCNAENDDGAFYCKQCDRPLSGVSGQDAATAREGRRTHSLVEDSGEVSPKPAAYGRDLLPRGATLPQPQISRKESPGSLRAVLLIIVLLLGAALAYLIFEKEALITKATFDERLKKIVEEHSLQFRALDAEIGSLRTQRDKLLSDLTTAEKNHNEEVAQLQSHIKELVEGRLPEARPLTTYRPITVLERDLRYTVAFFRDDTSEDVLRYKISLENTQETPLAPSPFDLVIFNENGLQIGASSIAFLDRLALEHIPPGDTKITLGSVRLMLLGKPSFFMIVSRRSK